MHKYKEDQQKSIESFIATNRRTFGRNTFKEHKQDKIDKDKYKLTGEGKLKPGQMPKLFYDDIPIINHGIYVQITPSGEPMPRDADYIAETSPIVVNTPAPTPTPPLPLIIHGKSKTGKPIQIVPAAPAIVKASKMIKPSKIIYSNPNAYTRSGKCRAVCIGINYTGTTYALNGCQNDADNMCRWLTSIGYDDIAVMKDNAASYSDRPTKDNLLRKLRQYIAKTAAGDVLFVHYSGHGGQIADDDADPANTVKNDEIDGQDETIFSMDGKPIVDDELHEILVEKLPIGAKLRVLFDCCHSGSALDLAWRLTERETTVRENKEDLSKDIIMISGCLDNQTSADAYIGKKYQGALTWAFLTCIYEFQKSMLLNNVKWTWKDLLLRMRFKLRKDGYDQIPQLDSAMLNRFADKIEL